MGHRGGAWACALAIGLGLAGCDPDVRLGATCERTSECTEPLVCVLGRCREECRVHRDCPLGARCVFGETAIGTCTLESDRCDETRPCGNGLVCEDFECFDPCEATCPGEGLCVSGVCRRDEGGDAGAPGDAAPQDASAPPYEPHRQCSEDGDCDPGEGCISEHGAVPSCRRLCTVSSECAGVPGSVCRMWQTASGMRTACTIACDPFTADGCLAPDACDVIGGLSAEGTYGSHVECRSVVGASGHLGDCGLAGSYEPLRCVIGHSCLYGDDPGSQSNCHQLCAAVGSGPPCPDGSVCEGRGSSVVRLGGLVVGWCVPQ